MARSLSLFKSDFWFLPAHVAFSSYDSAFGIGSFPCINSGPNVRHGFRRGGWPGWDGSIVPSLLPFDEPTEADDICVSLSILSDGKGPTMLCFRLPWTWWQILCYCKLLGMNIRVDRWCAKFKPLHFYLYNVLNISSLRAMIDLPTKIYIRTQLPRTIIAQ